MLWTGPHPVMYVKAGQDNVYHVFHIYQKKIVPINVSDMKLYQPFLEIPFSGIPQLRRAPPRPGMPQDVAPLRTLKGKDEAKNIKVDDLFLATTPFNGFEPISVMKFMSSSEDGKVTAQWMGSYKLAWHINTRLKIQQWVPGWFQPGTREFYFTPRPIHSSHPPFTNILSEDEIRLENIFVFNFKLRQDNRLPHDVAREGIRKYRTMDIPKSSEKGPRTYEDPTDDSL
jgi:hypothetical protein